MNRSLFATLATLALLPFLTGCDVADDQAHSLPRLISNLRYLKDHSEGLAEIAKGAPKADTVSGQAKYVAAAAQFNSTIALLIASIESPLSSEDAQQLEAMLASAGAAQKAFVEWYSPETEKKGAGDASVAVGLGLIDFVKFAVHESMQIEAERRQVFIEELRHCEWSRWGELGH